MKATVSNDLNLLRRCQTGCRPEYEDSHDVQPAVLHQDKDRLSSKLPVEVRRRWGVLGFGHAFGFVVLSRYRVC